LSASQSTTILLIEISAYMCVSLAGEKRTVRTADMLGSTTTHTKHNGINQSINQSVKSKQIKSNIK